MARVCQQQFDQALVDYGEAIRLSVPSNAVWARYHRATVLWIVGRYSEARAYYDAVCEWRGKPSFAEARHFLVQCDQVHQLTERGQAAEAEALAHEQRAALDQARRAAQPGSWIAAILDCLAGELPPTELPALADANNPEAVCESQYYAGEACLLSGRLAEARELFQRCVETDLVFDKQSFPPDPMNEYHLARWRLEMLDGVSGRVATPDGG